MGGRETRAPRGAVRAGTTVQETLACLFQSPMVTLRDLPKVIGLLEPWILRLPYLIIRAPSTLLHRQGEKESEDQNSERGMLQFRVQGQS